jgi:C4-type Zn-finger protein
LHCEMECTHDGFHAIHSEYDHVQGVLVYVWICERCGRRLREARRVQYRPSFHPRGSDTQLNVAH